MSSDSPVVMLFDAYNNSMAVRNNIAIPSNTSGLLFCGSDGTYARYFSVDSNGKLVTVNASIGTNDAAIPTSSMLCGGSDGTNLRAVRVFDLDTGAGTEFVSGVSIRLPSTGGSVVGGTITNPLIIDVAARGQTGAAACIPVVWANDYTPNILNQGHPSTSRAPNPASFSNLTMNVGMILDNNNRLETHSSVTTDEGSWRDDFSGSSLLTNVTGTINFTNNSAMITGSGTAFITELWYGKWIKKTTDAETLFVQIKSIQSDTLCTLSTPYTGTTQSTSGQCSDWTTFTAATGGSITVSGSNLSIVSGTANAQSCYVQHQGDYGPYTLTFTATVSQRIANQTISIGCRDNWASPLGIAEVRFTGTDNTVVSFVTSQDGTLQTTTCTIPNAGTTAASHQYKISIAPSLCTLSIDGFIVAKTYLHMPSPYQSMNIFAGSLNSAIVTATTLTCDFFYFNNVNHVVVDTDTQGDPLTVTLPNDGAFRQRVSIIYQAVATATADTLLSLVKSINGTAAGGATSIAVSAGKILRLTSITFSIRSGAANAAFGTMTLRINSGGAALISSPSEFRVDVGNTEAIIGAARSVTVPIPDGFELTGTAQLAVSVACQATTNILSVSLLGYEY